jgi:hypothetical protein
VKAVSRLIDNSGHINDLASPLGDLIASDKELESRQTAAALDKTVDTAGAEAQASCGGVENLSFNQCVPIEWMRNKDKGIIVVTVTEPFVAPLLSKHSLVRNVEYEVLSSRSQRVGFDPIRAAKQ